jgi:hypothetical protein
MTSQLKTCRNRCLRCSAWLEIDNIESFWQKTKRLFSEPNILLWLVVNVVCNKKLFMSSLLALLYLICNRSRRLVRSLIWFTEFIFYNVQWQSWIFTGVVGHDCLQMYESIEDDSIWCWCIMYIFHFYSLSNSIIVLSKWKQIVSVQSWLMARNDTWK